MKTYNKKNCAFSLFTVVLTSVDLVFRLAKSPQRKISQLRDSPKNNNQHHNNKAILILKFSKMSHGMDGFIPPAPNNGGGIGSGEGFGTAGGMK